MRKIDDPSAIPVRASIPAGQSLPGSFTNPGWFQEEEPGFPPTSVKGGWLNMLQSELLNALAEASIAEHETDEDQLAKAIVAIAQREAAGAIADVLTGQLRRESVSQIRLERGARGAIYVEIAGTIVSKTDTDLIFDMTTDLEAAETASTWIYVYVENVGGVLTPHLSATAPDALGGGNGGYHPSNVWRCIGAAYNDASSDLVDFHAPLDGGNSRPYFGGLIVPHDHSDFVINPGTSTAGGTYDAIDLNLPEIAREVEFMAQIGAGSVRVAYGPESVIGASEGVETGRYVVAAPIVHQAQAVFRLPIENPATPRIAWGITDGGTFNSHALEILGWR